jgi:hypothetical protein
VKIVLTSADNRFASRASLVYACVSNIRMAGGGRIEVCNLKGKDLVFVF